MSEQYSASNSKTLKAYQTKPDENKMQKLKYVNSASFQLKKNT